MLETVYPNPTSPPNPETQSAKILKMVKNERMGGHVPAWVKPETNKEQIASALSNASNPQTETQNRLAYNPGQDITDTSQEFKFGDLVDMVNPLHHAPLVGHAYREITGDEIKPIGQIVGGAIFGGAVGAAGGLVNIMVEEETGKDITGNALAMLDTPAKPDPATNTTILSFSDLSATPQHPKLNPETRPAREPITQITFTNQKNGLYAL